MYRIALLLGFWLPFALDGQVVAGRFLVELSDPPMGSLARLRTRSVEKEARAARIASAQRAAARMLEDRGGRVLDSVSAVMNGLIVDAAGADPRTLRALPGVVHVYPVEVLNLHLDHALPLHNVPAAWNAVGGRDQAGAGVKIAILDTGITPDHPGFLAPALTAPAGFPIASPEDNRAYTSGKIIVARDYRNLYQLTEPDDVRDRHGHGTAVAMCAAGVTNEGPWGTITGVAPQAWIGAYKISSLDSGSSLSDAVVKAIDDAVADGMDVINISSGSPLVRPVEESASTVAIERAFQAGVIVVVAAGNSGPAAASINNLASAPSAISAGGSDNDRLFGAGVEVAGLAPKAAIPRAGTLPDTPVAGVLKDIQPVEPASTGCSPLPEGSLQGAVALATGAGCLYETKLRNLENAGAAGAIIYVSNAASSPATMLTGAALLPAVMVSFEDGRTLRGIAADSPGTQAKIWFRGLAFANEPRKLRTSSSRGPTYNYQIKPDLSAAGYVYTAAQKVNDKGSEYDPSGYIAASGTSFSSPITAGAAAVLKAARPGLTAGQYRSLLVNRAAVLETPGSGVVRIQRTGNGALDLASSLGGNLTASPTSISFGTGGSTVDRVRSLRLTNLGQVADTYTFNLIRFDGAAPPLFGGSQDGSGAAGNFSLTLNAGETGTVFVFWKPSDLDPGEYQGMISIEGIGAGASILVPYWYGVPSNTPAAVTLVQAPAASVTVGQATTAFFRVLDGAGIAVTDPDAVRYDGSVTAGGGSIGAAAVSQTYPGILTVTLRAGPTAGRNTYRVSFAGLPATTLNVDGKAPAQ